MPGRTRSRNKSGTDSPSSVAMPSRCHTGIPRFPDNIMLAKGRDIWIARASWAGRMPAARSFASITSSAAIVTNGNTIQPAKLLSRK